MLRLDPQRLPPKKSDFARTAKLVIRHTPATLATERPDPAAAAQEPQGLVPLNGKEAVEEAAGAHGPTLELTERLPHDLHRCTTIAGVLLGPKDRAGK